MDELVAAVLHQCRTCDAAPADAARASDGQEEEQQNRHGNVLPLGASRPSQDDTNEHCHTTSTSRLEQYQMLEHRTSQTTLLVLDRTDSGMSSLWAQNSLDFRGMSLVPEAPTTRVCPHNSMPLHHGQILAWSQDTATAA